MRLRLDGLPDQRFGARKAGTHTFRRWDIERHARYLAHQRPDPDQVRHLREGIGLFRRMLESHEPRDEYSRKERE